MSEQRSEGEREHGSEGELEILDVRVAYQRDIEILRGVSLRAAARRVTVVIGPNGAGKSTLLRAIFGLAPVVGGRIQLDGADITGLSARQLLERRVALVPQERSVFAEMTVAENLQIGGWPRRRDRKWVQKRIDQVCEDFPLLRGRRADAAGDLSGGQQKLLEVARALIMDPTVLVLDEPTAGLAPQIAREVYEQIETLNAKRGLTILLVDQNVREALKLAGYVYVLEMGAVQAAGEAAHVLGRLDDIVRGWMGARPLKAVSG